MTEQTKEMYTFKMAARNHLGRNGTKVQMNLYTTQCMCAIVILVF